MRNKIIFAFINSATIIICIKLYVINKYTSNIRITIIFCTNIMIITDNIRIFTTSDRIIIFFNCLTFINWTFNIFNYTSRTSNIIFINNTFGINASFVVFNTFRTITFFITTTKT